MDDSFLFTYNWLLEDITLFYDVWVLGDTVKKQPHSADSYLSLVSYVAEQEYEGEEAKKWSIECSSSIDKSNRGALKLKKRLGSLDKFERFENLLADDDVDRNKKLKEEIWDYVLSVFIRFPLEELSQYPFWAAKIVICSSTLRLFELSEIKNFGDVCSSLYSSLRNSTTTIHELTRSKKFFLAIFPFMLSAYCSNAVVISRRLSSLFMAIESYLPRSPSADSSHSWKSQNTALSTCNEIRDPLQQSTFLHKIIGTILSHPLKCLAVNILCGTISPETW